MWADDLDEHIFVMNVHGLDEMEGSKTFVFLTPWIIKCNCRKKCESCVIPISKCIIRRASTLLKQEGRSC